MSSPGTARGTPRRAAAGGATRLPPRRRSLYNVGALAAPAPGVRRRVHRSPARLNLPPPRTGGGTPAGAPGTGGGTPAGAPGTPAPSADLQDRRSVSTPVGVLQLSLVVPAEDVALAEDASQASFGSPSKVQIVREPPEDLDRSAGSLFSPYTDRKQSVHWVILRDSMLEPSSSRMADVDSTEKKSVPVSPRPAWAWSPTSGGRSPGRRVSHLQPEAAGDHASGVPDDPVELDVPPDEPPPLDPPPPVLPRPAGGSRWEASAGGFPTVRGSSCATSDPLSPAPAQLAATQPAAAPALAVSLGQSPGARSPPALPAPQWERRVGLALPKRMEVACVPLLSPPPAAEFSVAMPAVAQPPPPPPPPPSSYRWAQASPTRFAPPEPPRHGSPTSRSTASDTATSSGSVPADGGDVWSTAPSTPQLGQSEPAVWVPAAPSQSASATPPTPRPLSRSSLHSADGIVPADAAAAAAGSDPSAAADTPPPADPPGVVVSPPPVPPPPPAPPRSRKPSYEVVTIRRPAPPPPPQTPHSLLPGPSHQLYAPAVSNVASRSLPVSPPRRAWSPVSTSMVDVSAGPDLWRSLELLASELTSEAVSRERVGWAESQARETLHYSFPGRLLTPSLEAPDASGRLVRGARHRSPLRLKATDVFARLVESEATARGALQWAEEHASGHIRDALFPRRLSPGSPDGTPLGWSLNAVAVAPVWSLGGSSGGDKASGRGSPVRVRAVGISQRRSLSQPLQPHRTAQETTSPQRQTTSPLSSVRRGKPQRDFVLEDVYGSCALLSEMEGHRRSRLHDEERRARPRPPNRSFDDDIIMRAAGSSDRHTAPAQSMNARRDILVATASEESDGMSRGHSPKPTPRSYLALALERGESMYMSIPRSQSFSRDGSPSAAASPPPPRLVRAAVSVLESESDRRDAFTWAEEQSRGDLEAAAAAAAAVALEGCAERAAARIHSRLSEEEALMRLTVLVAEEQSRAGWQPGPRRMEVLAAAELSRCGATTPAAAALRLGLCEAAEADGRACTAADQDQQRSAQGHRAARARCSIALRAAATAEDWGRVGITRRQQRAVMVPVEAAGRLRVALREAKQRRVVVEKEIAGQRLRIESAEAARRAPLGRWSVEAAEAAGRGVVERTAHAEAVTLGLEGQESAGRTLARLLEVERRRDFRWRLKAGELCVQEAGWRWELLNQEQATRAKHSGGMALWEAFAAFEVRRRQLTPQDPTGGQLSAAWGRARPPLPPASYCGARTGFDSDVWATAWRKVDGRPALSPPPLRHQTPAQPPARGAYLEELEEEEEEEEEEDDDDDGGKDDDEAWPAGAALLPVQALHWPARLSPPTSPPPKLPEPKRQYPSFRRAEGYADGFRRRPDTVVSRCAAYRHSVTSASWSERMRSLATAEEVRRNALSRKEARCLADLWRLRRLSRPTTKPVAVGVSLTQARSRSAGARREQLQDWLAARATSPSPAPPATSWSGGRQQLRSATPATVRAGPFDAPAIGVGVFYAAAPAPTSGSPSTPAADQATVTSATGDTMPAALGSRRVPVRLRAETMPVPGAGDGRLRDLRRTGKPAPPLRQPPPPPSGAAALGGEEAGCRVELTRREEAVAAEMAAIAAKLHRSAQQSASSAQPAAARQSAPQQRAGPRRSVGPRQRPAVTFTPPPPPVRTPPAAPDSAAAAAAPTVDEAADAVQPAGAEAEDGTTVPAAAAAADPLSRARANGDIPKDPAARRAALRTLKHLSMAENWRRRHGKGR